METTGRYSYRVYDVRNGSLRALASTTFTSLDEAAADARGHHLRPYHGLAQRVEIVGLGSDASISAVMAAPAVKVIGN